MKPASFSVVVPLYNKRDYVVEAILSAAAQQPQPMEIIVVDDGSTDDSVERIQALGLPMLKVLRQSNAGVSVARNVGVRAASGDWIAFLDADDRYAPGHLRVLQSLAEKFPDAGMLATGYCICRSDGSRTPIALNTGPILLNDFYGRWSRLTFTCANAIAVRRTLIQGQRIEFPQGERLGEDQDVWFRLAEAAPVAYSGDTLVDYRVDVAGSATVAVPSPEALLPCYVRLLQRLEAGVTPAALRPGARRLIGSHWLNVAWARYVSGDRRSAWALWRTKQACGNPVYWLRTGLRWAVSTARLPSSHRAS